jgi:hypothetical protein
MACNNLPTDTLFVQIVELEQLQKQSNHWKAAMFGITNYEEFYAMLVEDFDEFMKNRQSARCAMHCAITAYHLYEWVWGDWLKTDHATKTKLGITDRASFLSWIDNKCLWFPIIQALANGGKHFSPEQAFETIHVKGYGQGPFGAGGFGAGYLIIDYGEGAGEHRWQPAAHLLELAVRFWRDFFNIYRPTTVPPSTHHVD